MIYSREVRTISYFKLLQYQIAYKLNDVWIISIIPSDKEDYKLLIYSEIKCLKCPKIKYILKNNCIFLQNTLNQLCSKVCLSQGRMQIKWDYWNFWNNIGILSGIWIRDVQGDKQWQAIPSSHGRGDVQDTRLCPLTGPGSSFNNLFSDGPLWKSGKII